jgi:hypothetical protein
VGIASSISEIYYDDRAPLQLLTLQAPLTQVGCNFTPGGANPGNLPGGNVLSPAFNAIQSFSADAQGNPSEGIDTAADSLTMTFTLQGGASFATVANAITNGTLRIGLHVRAIGTQGGSDSFVNGNFVPVPPAAMAGGALMAGLLGIGAIRRRRSLSGPECGFCSRVTRPRWGGSAITARRSPSPRPPLFRPRSTSSPPQAPRPAPGCRLAGRPRR